MNKNPKSFIFYLDLMFTNTDVIINGVTLDYFPVCTLSAPGRNIGHICAA